MSAKGQTLVIEHPRPVKGQTACVACGEHHGSDGRARNCVRDAFLKTREELRLAKLHIDDLEKRIAGAKRYLG